MRAVAAALFVLAVVVAGSARIVQAAGPTSDPGFPYVDVDCDELFDAGHGDLGRATGVDVEAIARETGTFDTAVATGSYTPPATPACLVAPRSVRLAGPDGGCLELIAELDLTVRGKVAADDCLSLFAGRRLTADGAALVAGGDLTLRAGDAAGPDRILSAVGAKIRSKRGLVELYAVKEIDIDSIDLRAQTDVTIDTENFTLAGEGFEPGGIAAHKAKIRSKDGYLYIDSDFDYLSFPETGPDALSIALDRSKLQAVGVFVVAYGAGINAEHARIDGTRYDNITLDSAGGLIAMDGVTMTRSGSIDIMTWTEPENPLQHSRIFAAGAKLRVHSDSIWFDSGGCGGTFEGPSELVAPDMSLVAATTAELGVSSSTDPGTADLRGARLIGKEDLNVVTYDDSPDSTIDVRGAQIHDPILPTFFAEHVLGDPTPNAPDLAWNGIELNVTQIAESEIQVDWDIVNYGPKEVPAGVQIRFVWSADTALDAGDLELGPVTIPVPVPGHGGEVTGSVSFTVPDGEPAYVIAVVDPDDVVAELDEDNNTTLRARPLPDLAFVGNFAITPTSATDAVLGWTLRNDGSLDAPAGVQIEFHLSSDRDLDGGDTLLQTATIGAPLPSRQTVTGSESFSNLPPDGLFFIIVTVDPADAVIEFSETNNQKVAAIGPDITIAHVIARYSMSAQQFTITARILNEGAHAAFGTIETRFGVYMGGTPHQIVGSFSFDDLAPGETHEEIVSLPFVAPAGAPTLWLMDAMTDAADAIPETEEFDNGTFVFVYQDP